MMVLTEFVNEIMEIEVPENNTEEEEVIQHG